MLRISSAIAIPAIVGDIHQHLSAVFGELPDFVRENRFVADKNAEPGSTGIKRRCEKCLEKNLPLPWLDLRRKKIFV